MILKRTMTFTLCLLLLTSCSSARLAYNNLNWLISWKSSDYVPLNREQKSWLSARVDEHRAWHCRHELPRYRELLSGVQGTLDETPTNATALLQQLPELEPAVDRLLVEIAPTLADLFQQLDTSQIAALKANLAEQQQEMHKEYVAPDTATQARERSQRLEKRLTRWLGRLSPEQRARIDQWSAELEGQNRIWLDNRHHWQEQLMLVLEDRSHAEFSERITQLLVERERYWTETFRQRTKINSRKGADMLADVLNMASDRQRAQMTAQFAKLEQDLRRLECPAPSSAA